jgi:hypothetical protein
MSTDRLSLLGLAAKRATRDPSVLLHPLTNGTLQLVLDFVGAGQFLFVSLVSKAWNEAYRTVKSASLPCARTCTYKKPDWITCAPSTTLLSAAFASRERLRLADIGLRLQNVESTAIAQIAALHSSVATLSAAYELGFCFTDDFLRAVAQAGRVTEMAWLHLEQRLSLPRDIINDAAAGGHIDMLIWLYDRSCELTSETSRRAAANGHLNAIKYLFSAGCLCDQHICTAAAHSNNVGLLRWLRQNGVPWNGDWAAYVAAANNDTQMLQHLQQQGVRFNFLTMYNAARKGYLAACQFLYAQGCDWTAAVCTAAACANSLETLAWLHEHECPWDAFEICITAAHKGRTEILHYVYEQEGAAEFTAAEQTLLLNMAEHADHLIAAAFLREQGAEWPAQLR